MNVVMFCYVAETLLKSPENRSTPRFAIDFFMDSSLEAFQHFCVAIIQTWYTLFPWETQQMGNMAT